MKKLHTISSVSNTFKQARLCFMAGSEKGEKIPERETSEKGINGAEKPADLNREYQEGAHKAKQGSDKQLDELAVAVSEKGKPLDQNDAKKDDLAYALQKTLTVNPLGGINISIRGMSEVRSLKDSTDWIVQSVKRLISSNKYNNQRDLQDAIALDINNAPQVHLERLAGKALSLDFNGIKIDFPFLKPSGDKAQMQQYGVESVNIHR